MSKQVKEKKFRFILPAILMSVAIFIASSIPQDQLNIPDFEWSDKILHLMVYFVYGLSLISAIQTLMKNKAEKQIKLTVIVFGLMFAASDEIHQFFVPGRFMEIEDWIADAVGVLVSLIFYKKIEIYIEKLNKHG